MVTWPVTRDRYSPLYEADRLDATRFRGNALVGSGTGPSARTSARDTPRQGIERARKVSDSGVETPAGADSRPPGARVGLGRGRAVFFQLELTDDDPGGTLAVALVPPETFPDPPPVLTLIVEQRAAAGADVVFKFRHC